MRLVQQAYIQKKLRAIIVIEGVDTAGKGGLIRRLAWSMDPRALKVWPIGPPNAIEKEEHYLSRFWSKLPAPGEIAVFDRSWYGRVLVEAIDGIIDEKTSRRAFNEINEFEKMLLDDGIRIVKLLLKISKKEQANRLIERLDDPTKNWKLTSDDLRNREKWDTYQAHYKKMVSKTSSPNAQWKIVMSNEKEKARAEAMNYIVKTLSKGLSLKPATVSDKLRKQIRKLNK